MNGEWHIIAVLLAGHFLAVATPGPNTAFILQTAMHNRRAAYIAAMGIFPAGMIWASAGLAGMGQLIAAAPALEQALRITGGCYLCWIGWRMVSRRSASQDVADAGPVNSVAGLLTTGFMTNFLNPKAIAWYTSIFAAAGAFELSAPHRAIVIVAMPGMGFLWYLFVATAISSPAVRGVLTGQTRWIDLVSGLTMILFGAKLLVLG
ncbi:LysE family transporter [Roseiarcaceae bacterium H3SJ34-1]|uniref:LysE family translocator n=1 Tax=Terripilifer ovatus TaxID=3032367 RepID=UPI003AB98F7D|nr:LysE family transporter [Roseiarcaceae bacterium H3SJ34-1]